MFVERCKAVALGRLAPTASAHVVRQESFGATDVEVRRNRDRASRGANRDSMVEGRQRTGSEKNCTLSQVRLVDGVLVQAEVASTCFCVFFGRC